MPEEVGVGLTLGKGTASAFLHIGRVLAERLSATRAAFARGELDYPRVRVIVQRTAHVDAACIAAVEAQILDQALAPGARADRPPPGPGH